MQSFPSYEQNINRDSMHYFVETQLKMYSTTSSLIFIYDFLKDSGQESVVQRIGAIHENISKTHLELEKIFLERGVPYNVENSDFMSSILNLGKESNP